MHPTTNILFKLTNSSKEHWILYSKLHIVDIINTKDKKLWNKILAHPSHALYTLLSPKRKRNLQLLDRGHDYELPNIRTDFLKQTSIKICKIVYSIVL